MKALSENGIDIRQAKQKMGNKLIIANWKMNPDTLVEAEELSVSIARGLASVNNLEVVVCAPFVYLTILANIANRKFSLGGQNCFYEQKGAYTGEVSASMLKDLGSEYVIVGHSERKKYFGENNEIINKKTKAALKAGLNVILCIGEETRDSFDSRGQWTKEIDPALKDQLMEALADVKKPQMLKISIAYEPVWAIGTGNPATPDDVFSVKLFIRKILSELYDRKTADSIRVLYGGSTDKKNASMFTKEGQADGLLVGGASLDETEFLGILKSI